MKTFLILLFSLNSILIFAQPGNSKRANHWYFGWNAGLDFSSGTMQDDPNGQANIDEGTASISDTAGNLLFYVAPIGGTMPNDSNMNIYNRNHQIMQNGTDIDCGWSGRQNSIIVPLPESDNLYYLFTLTDISVQMYYLGYVDSMGFKYSIIDMNLDGGLGAVTQKNIPIYIASVGDTLSEILTAVHHANCKDVWIMIHRFNADEYLAYKLTENGLDSIPIVSQIGSHGNIGNSIGWGMKFSYDGEYAIKNTSVISPAMPDTLSLFMFNNDQGLLTNEISIQIDTFLLGKEFSPNCKYIYTIEIINDFTLPIIAQYDISEWNKQSIINSKIVLGSFLLMTPDISITPLNNIIFSGELSDSIGIIEYPNNQGFACSINSNVLTITNNCGWNFPNFLRSYFNTDTSAYDCNTATTEQVIPPPKFNVFPNPLNKQAEINTKYREIVYYNLYDIKGNLQIKNKDYKLKQTENTYLFTNKNLKGGIYILSGVFADKGCFNIKLIINQ